MLRLLRNTIVYLPVFCFLASLHSSFGEMGTATNDRKGRLKAEYIGNNTATQLKLEQNRLRLLKTSLTLKRPIQSLRVSGLTTLSQKQQMSLIQEIETKATLTAIENKKRDIRILEQQLKSNPSSSPNSKLIHIQQKKLEKKIQFLRSCDRTKFCDWRRKNFVSDSMSGYTAKVSERKAKRKVKGKARKDRKKEKTLIERDKLALEEDLVINFTDVDVPLFSIGVLSYGPGWIPSPQFNDLQFRVDGFNAGNKQAWKAVFKDSESVNDVPLCLLKKPVTSTCSFITDPAIAQVKEKISSFVGNIKPKRPT